MIYIRADANRCIGVGHIMRCMSIADAIKKIGEKVCFLVADENGRALVEQRGFSCIVLHTDWRQLEQELPSVKELLKKEGINGILIDSYYVTEKYLSTLQKYRKVIYIDDMNKFLYPCDILINYSVYAEDISYRSSYLHTKLLLGCQYAPLRREFADIPPKRIRKKGEHILVLTGGSDPYHFALRFVKEGIERWKRKEERLQFYIICGKYNVDIAELQEIGEQYQEVIIYKHTENLAAIMKDMDIAISAGGSTLYELCACGVPTITYQFADNQEKNVRKFDEIGLMQNSGDIRTPEYSFGKLLDKIEKLSKDKKERENLSNKMQQMIDGQGARRIAEILPIK